MLINEKLPLDLAKFAQEDQVLHLSGACWSDYEKLESPEYSQYLISYFDNQITIMSPGRNHERIAELIGILIEAYCEKIDLLYFPFGSTRLKEGEQVGKEPDTGYAFEVDKEHPDLAVEVNFTSGSINDLTKYRYLKIKEVWLWQDLEIKFYYLDDGSYRQITTSFVLPGIEAEILTKYLHRGFKESPLNIKKDWLIANPGDN